MAYEYDERRPIVTVDVALFTVMAPADGGRPALHVALVPRRTEPEVGTLGLPGGYVRLDEDADMEATASRVLREKCGLQFSYLEQLRTYSGDVRDPRDWSVTTAYFALVPAHALTAAAPGLELALAEGIGGLPFDHGRIVADGVARVRGKATYTTLAAKLLPETFTMREMRETYEALLGREILETSFRRVVDSLRVPSAVGDVPFLRDTGEKRGGRKRPAAVYARATDDLLVFPQRF